MPQKIAAAVALIVLGSALAVLLRPAGPVEAGRPQDLGRYRIVAGESSYVLYDQLSGVAWVLTAKPGQERFAWLPTRRLNTEADAQKWRLLERERK